MAESQAKHEADGIRISAGKLALDELPKALSAAGVQAIPFHGPTRRGRFAKADRWGWYLGLTYETEVGIHTSTYEICLTTVGTIIKTFELKRFPTNQLRWTSEETPSPIFLMSVPDVSPEFVERIRKRGRWVHRAVNV